MKYFGLRFWIFCLVCTYGTNSVAFCLQKEETLTRKISFAEGLKTQVIFDLYVDDKGLLFLGTDKGLVSYNGVFFKTHGFQDNLALSINKIQQDQQGVIWCKNFSNQIFYFENDTLKPYQKLNKLLEEQDANLVDFTFVEEKLYVLTEKSLIFENTDGDFTEVISFEKDEKQFFFSLFLDQSKLRLFVSSNEDIKVISNNKVIGKYTTAKGQKEIAFFDDELYYIKKGQKISFTLITL